MQISSTINNKYCLTTLSGDTAPTLELCDPNRDEQRWILKDGKIKPRLYPDSCFFIQNNGNGGDTRVGVASCQHNWPSQNDWGMSWGDVYGWFQSNLCLNDEKNVLQATKCSGQTWRTSYTDTTTANQYKNIANQELCINADNAVGPINLKKCDTSLNQQWVFKNGQFSSVNYPDSCLFVGDDKIPVLRNCREVPQPKIGKGWNYVQSAIKNTDMGIVLDNNNNVLSIAAESGNINQKFIPVPGPQVKIDLKYFNDPLTEYPDLSLDDQLNGAKVSIHFISHDYNAIGVPLFEMGEQNPKYEAAAESSFINTRYGKTDLGVTVLNVTRLGESDRYNLSVDGSNRCLVARDERLRIADKCDINDLTAQFKFVQLPGDEPYEYRLTRADNGQYFHYTLSGQYIKRVTFTPNPDPSDKLRINIVTPSNISKIFLKDRADGTITPYTGIQSRAPVLTTESESLPIPLYLIIILFILCILIILACIYSIKSR
ncbi:MAG: hypothetical protein Harvfovirus8_27 [Harvfovirus sp.]|uniref:Ricin B lectin domain-containing protein n=1 Tax=Harvfovirus sp. TaxID=2487768 RepID=A0A3G5A0V9_9VIRU|nr:MAG: hypothetical protein Harvfovirus8_27 [Harvfovirus sp.]